jgi:signal transduction histidine kinase
MDSLFPKDVNKKVLQAIIWVQLFAALFFLFTPIYLSSQTIPYYLIFCGFLLFYLLNIVIKVIYMKRPFSIWVGGTYLLVFVAGINDILFSQSIIESYYVMPIGIFIFAVVQALVITRMFSLAFLEVETLSNKLKNINRNQKDIIQERTSLLNMQAQELQRSNQIKDKVFSIISHDLRAPIKSLSTVLTWVAEDDLSFEELKKSLGSISKNVDTLNLTLENLLQWSRSQLMGLKSEPELIDVRKPIQEIIELFKIQSSEKGIKLKYNISDRFAVFVDKHNLNLLLRNLISNAIKFTHENGIVEISVSNYEENYTLICVKDDGMGMSKDAIEKVFSTTEHFTTYGTNNEKGTGLGLLLCKEYVDGSNGKIWIESELGKGTSILFTLPNFAIN